jgi:M-phase inducer tyrosine phosphatase
LLIGSSRKRAAIGSRPGLIKSARFASTGNVNFKSQSSIPTAMNRSLTAPQINLEELFGSSSPERTRKSSSPSRSFLAPPPRPFGFGEMDGSPVSSSNRSRPCRPKGKIRRTLSMFQDPAEVMTEDGEVEMGSPRLELGCPTTNEKQMLPSFTVRDDSLRRISVETMGDVLAGAYKDRYDELVIVDCRFDYEYAGGHINGAVNHNAIDTLETEFHVQDGPRPEIENKRRLIIFHCEFSAHRAPRM